MVVKANPEIYCFFTSPGINATSKLPLTVFSEGCPDIYFTSMACLGHLFFYRLSLMIWTGYSPPFYFCSYFPSRRHLLSIYAAQAQRPEQSIDAKEIKSVITLLL